MHHRLRCSSSFAALALGLAALTVTAHAGEPEEWSFDESTSGEDVHWVSPTAVQPNAAEYIGEYEITGVFVTVLVFGFPLEVDVTDQVPPELLMGTEIVPGPAPFVLLSASLLYPDPPEPIAISLNLTIGVNENGFGYVDATDVILGTIDVGFGEVQILAVRVAGTVTVTPIGTYDPADINSDGAVNFDDLLIVLSTWGPCPEPPIGCPADVDGDGEVGFGDLLEVLANWS